MIEPALREALRTAAAAPRILVAADYDGTLAPIVDDPAMAHPLPQALDALSRLGALEGVHAAVVSGRSLEALRRLTGAPATVRLVGTHGLEGLRTARSATGDVAALVTDLVAVATRFYGAEVETKPVGAALHYRRAADPKGAAAEARRVAGAHGARVLDGKMVVEALLGEGNKGTALLELKDAAQADAVVFFGDDTTDEAAFAVMAGADVSVKVGPGETAAHYRVAGPDEVAASLSALLDRRRLK